MWEKNYRQTQWAALDQPWDILVIGGGITGAGIFNLAARKGLNVLLVDANDFSFGTSSRSSKLVHGGLRYLRNKQYDVVSESVKERERMIRQAPGLVEPLAFVFPNFAGEKKTNAMLRLGVSIYDLMVPKWNHQLINPQKIQALLPTLRTADLEAGNLYYDALVDDSRLVLRVIQDGMRAGGIAINYAKVVQLLRDANGQVIGAGLQDQTGAGGSAEVKAKVVINAAGPWSDEVRQQLSLPPTLRKLRGSHIIVPQSKIPIKCAITLMHPRDNRALFAIPWHGTTMIGTTDLDHASLEGEPCMSKDEFSYLLEITNVLFPDCTITDSDVISSFAGLRPVINTGAATPSQESRAHKVFEENGLVTITGGKLTIFRVMAADTLNHVAHRLPGTPRFHHKMQVFDPLPKQETQHLDAKTWAGLAGRLGADVHTMLKSTASSELELIDAMQNLWGELQWACRHEAVVHLDDLLLRRVRLGLTSPKGGAAHWQRIRNLCQHELGWTDAQWQAELNRYQTILAQYYASPA